MKLESYLGKISDTTKELGVGTYAFRGQSNTHWPLHSGATRRLRKQLGEGVQFSPEFPNLYLDYHQSTLIAPARTQGLGVESGREISDLELLAKLQHLGAATGLLDFSWDPLVGIWFACRDLEGDGRLYVINTNDPIQVGMISTDESAQRVTTLFLPDRDLPTIAWWEPVASGDAMARILRQRSVFVIGRPMVPEDCNILGGITIAEKDKKDLIGELGLLDVSRRSLFLDAHGFAQANSVEDVVSLSQDDYRIAGNRYYQRGEYQYAIDAYDRFLALNPYLYTIYFLRANANAELRNHGDAIEDYDKAIGAMTEFPRSIILDHMIYFNRANSKVELRQYKEAVQDYLRAIGSAPDPGRYHYNLANTYADMACFEEATSAYEKVESADWHAIFNKGNALMCLGRFSEANECYIQAAAQAPNDETVLQNVWTSSRLLSLLDGHKFTCHLDASRMYLRVCVAEDDLAPELHQYTYMIVGRVGNVGNFGFINPGGKGSPGKGPIYIGISTSEAE